MIGVSPTTVSNVIRGRTKEVSPEMEKKVKKILEECNYIPNMSAINLAKNNSNVIGFVINAKTFIHNNVVQDFFISELMGGIESGVRKRGYYLMIYISEQIDEIMKFVTSWNIDGLVVQGFTFDSAQILKKGYKKPIVFIDGYFNKDEYKYTNVGVEDYKGTYDITNYLIECGHKKIGFISDSYIAGDYERYCGFLDALEKADISKEMCQKIYIDKSLKGIELCAEEIRGKINDITALIFCSDYYAIAVMGYLQDYGIKIPEDISIVGYDDAAVASFARPKLTTVHQCTLTKADKAVDKLLEMIEESLEYGENIVLSTELRIRDTVKYIESE